MGVDGSPPRAKRVRTEVQLDRKRQTDRAKHKINRAENKTRLENIESDVSNVRAGVELLLSQLHTLVNPRPASVPDSAAYFTPQPESHAAFSDIHTMVRSSISAESSTSNHSSSYKIQIKEYASESDAGINSDLIPSATSSAAAAAAAATAAAPNAASAHRCRCGISHVGQADCLELSSLAMLYQAHTVLSLNPQLAIHIPRNPSLSNYLLFPENGNTLTRILSSNMRQFQTRNVETLFGLYFLAYRLLRWRLYPNDESFQDVPEFVRPSELQVSVLHPLSIDYLPWPRLRDYLCTNQNRDIRHSVDLYMRSINFKWPADKQLLCRDKEGAFGVNTNFEDYVRDLSCWELGTPWSETFPDLVHYLK